MATSRTSTESKFAADERPVSLKLIGELADCKTLLGKTKTARLFRDEKTGEEFVLKNQKIRRDALRYSGFFVRRRLENHEVALEKLAFDLYELCGVFVPKSMLIRSESKAEDESSKYASTIATGRGHVYCLTSDDTVGEQRIRDEVRTLLEDHHLHIASQKLPGFKTLDELFDIKKESKDSDLNEQRAAALATQQINGKPIRGLFESLAAIAFLFDYDAIGSNFNNFGFIDMGTYYQFVKIDPGDVELLSRPDGEPIETNGFTKLDLPKGEGTILAEFAMRGATHWNIKKAFASATPAQKIEGLKKIASLTNEQISNTIHKTQGSAYLLEEDKQNFVEELIRRRDLFKAQYAAELSATNVCSESAETVSTNLHTLTTLKI